MSENPLERHFRRAQLWVRLPSGGRWYQHGEVKTNESCEVQIKGISAIDEVMLNTPDAMLNGHALESVIKSCVPEVQNVKALVQPDIEAIFLGIKAASNRGKFEITRKCTECDHENTFDVICQHLMHTTTFIEDSDTRVEIDNELVVHIKPYSYDQRTIMIRKQLEERNTINDLNEAETADDTITRMARIAESVERMAQLTYSLISDAIVAVEILKPEHVHVTNKEHINQWLTNIDRNTAAAIVKAVDDLNAVGPPRSIKAKCQNCGHEWDEALVYDPTLFFT